MSESRIAQPFTVVRGGNFLFKVAQIIEKYVPDLVVVGVSEGKSADESKDFALELEKVSGVKTIFEDETLTTQDAQRLAQSANIKRSRRQRMEDAFAAAVMLQSYLDKQKL